MGSKRNLHPNDVTRENIGAAMKVRSALGPGLLESAYEACLAYELQKTGFDVKMEVPLPVVCEKVKLDAGYRIDLLVEDVVLVELKCVESIAPIHEAQVISCLRLSGKKLGLLINFKVVHLKDGVKRFVNNFIPSAFSASSAVQCLESVQ
jgi:GxxExxY protein